MNVSFGIEFDFQLPLSGSQLEGDEAEVRGGVKTFNSLSRDHGRELAVEALNLQLLLSTPSLGITRRWPVMSTASPQYFQLPLSGSHNAVDGIP
jgi:hypothetical protein